MELVINLKNDKNKYISINKKLILNFSIPMIVFILTFIMITNITFKTEFDSYVLLKNKTIMDESNIDIHKAYINNDWDIKKLKEISEKLFKSEITLEILDKNRNYIWHISKSMEGSCNDEFHSVKKHMKKINKNWNDKLVKEESPIYNDKNQLIGYKILLYNKNIYYLSDDVSFLNDMNNTLIILSTISILSILIIALLVARNISYPIKKVSYVTKSMKIGNYKNLEYTGTIEEVNDLILSINNLSESLEAQEHIRKRLITDLSHELKTPLTSMHGHLQAIIDGIWEPTTTRLVNIDKELMRITYLIEQLKNLNNLEHEPLHKSEVNLKEMVLTLICNVQAIAFKKNININYVLDDITAYVDEVKLSQVVTNILSNSIKYNEIGGIVQIGLYEEKDNVHIKIEDNGIGIGDEDINYIFERFYRGDKSRCKNNEGLGIGLTISKMIIEEHGGDIKVNTKLGKGSEFIILIPK